jgi:hypothetical protein
VAHRPQTWRFLRCLAWCAWVPVLRAWPQTWRSSWCLCLEVVSVVMGGEGIDRRGGTIGGRGRGRGSDTARWRQAGGIDAPSPCLCCAVLPGWPYYHYGEARSRLEKEMHLARENARNEQRTKQLLSEPPPPPSLFPSSSISIACFASSFVFCYAFFVFMTVGKTLPITLSLPSPTIS